MQPGPSAPGQGWQRFAFAALEPRSGATVGALQDASMRSRMLRHPSSAPPHDVTNPRQKGRLKYFHRIKNRLQILHGGSVVNYYLLNYLGRTLLLLGYSSRTRTSSCGKVCLCIFSSNLFFIWWKDCRKLKQLKKKGEAAELGCVGATGRARG